MIIKFMGEKLIITFDEYNKIVEKLAIEIHKEYKPTVLIGIMSFYTYFSDVHLFIFSLSQIF